MEKKEKSIPWECPQCHEKIEPQFDSCWKCQCPQPGIDVEQTAGHGPDQAICFHCFKPVGEHDDFCSACGTPLSSHASIDPLKSVYAQGDTYWKATHGPVNKMIFWSMWLLFGPFFLMCLQMFLELDVSLLRKAEALFGLLILISITVVYGLILWKVTRNYPRSQNRHSHPTAQNNIC